MDNLNIGYTIHCGNTHALTRSSTDSRLIRCLMMVSRSFVWQSEVSSCFQYRLIPFGSTCFQNLMKTEVSSCFIWSMRLVSLEWLRWPWWAVMGATRPPLDLSDSPSHQFFSPMHVGKLYIQIHTDIYIYMQIHTDTYRYIQIHTDTYRYIQIQTDTYRYIQIHTDTYRYINTHITHITHTDT